jgi:hypothetical protein
MTNSSQSLTHESQSEAWPCGHESLAAKKLRSYRASDRRLVLPQRGVVEIEADRTAGISVSLYLLELQ